MMAFRSLPHPDILRQLLSYDPQTGRLYWRTRTIHGMPDGSTDRVLNIWNTRYAGKPADSLLTGAGYRSVCVHNHRMAAHRVAWAWWFGRWPNDEIDHINHVRSDNRIANLRDVSRATNCRNQSLRSDNTSGLVGIRQMKPKAWGARWQVIIAEDGRIVGRKAFKCIGQAIRFRNGLYDSRGFAPQHGAVRDAFNAEAIAR